MSGLVVFRLGDRDYATPLAAVREVVRLEGLVDLPGMTPPLAGVLDLRGTALPVLDLRPAAVPGARGDVLVLQEQPGTTATGTVGVAVDRVTAVVADEDLPGAGAAEAGVLPEYVVQVLRGPDGVVFLVDLVQMLASAQT